MTKLEIFKPDRTFMVKLAGEMRVGDAMEVMATSGRSPFQALYHACDVSEKCWGARIAGQPAAMWGVRPMNLLGNIGVPWALTGWVVEKYPVLFFKTSKDMLALM